MTTTAAAPAKSSPWRQIVDLYRQAALDTAYLLTTFPIALAGFLIVVIGLSLGVSLIVVWVGFVIVALSLIAAGGFAWLERIRLRWIGLSIPSFPAPPRAGGPWTWTKALFTNRQRWREVAHALVALPLSTVTWSLALAWVTGCLAGLFGWIWGPISRRDPAYIGLAELLHLPLPPDLVNVIVGLIFLVSAPWVLRGWAWLHGELGKALLGPTRTALAQQIDALARSRAGGQAAEVQSLRRLERDIHDGPQQRLIRLGLDLATAQRRLESGDTEAVGTLLAEARAGTDQAIAELRALSRGIAPPILTDRGLMAALAAVCAAAPVLVNLDSQLPEGQRLPIPVETALYFSACEAIANAAKHAQAAQVTVRLSVSSSAAVLTVADDGRGGAAIVPGHGLEGLANRAASVEGRLEITSPPGAGTVICVTIPLPPDQAPLSSPA